MGSTYGSGYRSIFGKSSLGMVFVTIMGEEVGSGRGPNGVF